MATTPRVPTRTQAWLGGGITVAVGLLLVLGAWHIAQRTGHDLSTMVGSGSSGRHGGMRVPAGVAIGILLGIALLVVALGVWLTVGGLRAAGKARQGRSAS